MVEAKKLISTMLLKVVLAAVTLLVVEILGPAGIQSNTSIGDASS